MKRHNKKFLLIMIIFCMLSLFGCKNVRLNTYKNSDEAKIAKEQEINQNQQEDDNNNNESPTGSADNDVIDVTDTKEPTPAAIQPVANTELIIYNVNINAEIETVPVLIPEQHEITPQLVVDTVTASLADNSLTVGVESVTTTGDTVIISFYADKSPSKNIGAGFETSILDAIALSLFDNLEDYNNVIYRIEGNAYSSGHIETDIDEVYLSD
ncbi:MAG TPA: hypothetical protein VJ888_07065 [Mobilitalea sp.]|nr:hypothetical protein [Mobilitalea sp.]